MTRREHWTLIAIYVLSIGIRRVRDGSPLGAWIVSRLMRALRHFA